MTTQLKGTWAADKFFEKLTATNRLALAEGFTFCRVSGLEGFEEAVAQMQNTAAFVCVSDVADGYTDLNNTPRTRRIKTVFFAMRHAAEDMEARAECMATMRELFRQFATRLILEKVRLEQNCIYNPQNEACNASRTKRAKNKTKREAQTKRSVPSVRFFITAATLPFFKKFSPDFHYI